MTCIVLTWSSIWFIPQAFGVNRRSERMLRHQLSENFLRKRGSTVKSIEGKPLWCPPLERWSPLRSHLTGFHHMQLPATRSVFENQETGCSQLKTLCSLQTKKGVKKMKANWVKCDGLEIQFLKISPAVRAVMAAGSKTQVCYVHFLHFIKTLLSSFRRSFHRIQSQAAKQVNPYMVQRSPVCPVPADAASDLESAASQSCRWPSWRTLDTQKILSSCSYIVVYSSSNSHISVDNQLH